MRPGEPRPGEVYELAETQYKFGLGPLVCRVVRPLALVLFDGDPWWHIRAEVKEGTFATVDRVPQPWRRRELYVRAAALPAARRGSPSI